jgi:hypothetical protein
METPTSGRTRTFLEHDDGSRCEAIRSGCPGAGNQDIGIPDRLGDRDNSDITKRRAARAAQLPIQGYLDIQRDPAAQSKNFS